MCVFIIVPKDVLAAILYENNFHLAVSLNKTISYSYYFNDNLIEHDRCAILRFTFLDCTHCFTIMNIVALNIFMYIRHRFSGLLSDYGIAFL